MFLAAAGTACLAVSAMFIRAMRKRSMAADDPGANKDSDARDTLMALGMITLMISGVSLIIKGIF